MHHHQVPSEDDDADRAANLDAFFLWQKCYTGKGQSPADQRPIIYVIGLAMLKIAPKKKHKLTIRS